MVCPLAPYEPFDESRVALKPKSVHRVHLQLHKRRCTKADIALLMLGAGTRQPDICADLE